MPPTIAPSSPNRSHGSRALVFVILGIIVAAFVAFMVLRPDPGGAHRGATTTSQPASRK